VRLKFNNIKALIITFEQEVIVNYYFVKAKLFLDQMLITT